MRFEIKHRWNGSVLFSLETESLKLAIEAAVKSAADLSDADLRGANLRDANLRDANLSDADLRGANLRGANLRDANLRDANLSGANLSGANLRDANLRDANLSGANLSGADLSDADLSDANLRDANLRDANLSDADLRGANLSVANLRGANLTPIRDDVWAVLCSSPVEVAALRVALVEGRIDGTCYEGDCACLVGTLANARHCEFTKIPGLRPNPDRPAERWFLNIKRGSTPQDNQHAVLVLGWIDQWLGAMRNAVNAGAFGEIK